MKTSLWIAQEDTIIQRFMQTPFWTQLMAIPDLICIKCGGSRFYGDKYLDDESDYDIMVVVEKGKYMSPSRFVKIGDRMLHWTVKSLSTYCNDPIYDKELYRNWALHAGMVKFNHFERNMILYENPKYSSIIDKLIIQRNKIQIIHFYKYVEKLNYAIIWDGPYHTLSDLYIYPKAFYQIFAAFQDITGIGDVNWIRSIKHKNECSYDEIIQVRDEFVKIMQWCNEHPINIQNMENELYECFFDKNQNLLL